MTIVYVGLGVVIFAVGMLAGFGLGTYLLMLDVRDELNEYELNEYRQEFDDRMSEPDEPGSEERYRRLHGEIKLVADSPYND